MTVYTVPYRPLQNRPRRAVGVNRLSPLADGLTGLWLPTTGGPPGNLAINASSSLVASPSYNTPTPDPNGLTWSFNGSTQYVDLGTAGSPNGASTASVSVWMYRSASGTSCGCGEAGSTAAGRFAILWFTDNEMYISCGNSGTLVFAEITRNLSGWHHVACVFDAQFVTNANRFKIYVDGVQASGVAYSTTVPTTIGQGATWIWGGDASNRLTTGAIDMMARWNRAISASEVLQLYNWDTRWDLVLQPTITTMFSVGAPAATTWPGAFINAGYY